MEKQVHLRISGLVQGVFFRARTKDEADKLGLTGWVRNLPDGRVEAVIAGPETAVKEMVDWCRRGPRGARVTDVEITPETTEPFTGFTIRY